jgi:hypothetical protein
LLYLGAGYGVAVDNELIALARIEVGRQHGLTAAQSARLVGDNAQALHADAKAMAKELNVLDPTERARDDGGRFTGDMNQLIRQASGRR